MPQAANPGKDRERNNPLPMGRAVDPGPPQCGIKSDVAVVVSCVKSKSVGASPLAICDQAPSNARGLVDAWIDTCSDIAAFPVGRLYKGVSWSYVRKAQAADPGIRFYVASAGFGLASFEGRIPAYDASFSGGPNQVASKVQGEGRAEYKHQLWWHLLNERLNGVCHPIAHLTASKTIVVAGADYVKAIGEDLRDLATRVGSSGLLIISPGKRPPDQLGDCWLPVSTGSEARFRVIRAALATRVLLWVLETAVPAVGWNFDCIRRLAETELCDGVHASKPTGVRQSDSAVTSWIRDRLPNLSSGSPSPSALLREFRDLGNSCSQERFHRLFSVAATARSH
jgi:hypothetical protein